MAELDPLHARLTEIRQVQSRPITDDALLARMRTDATKWINGIHAQGRRILDDYEARGAEPGSLWQLEIDFYFLLVALTRLRRAVTRAAKIASLQSDLDEYVDDFDIHLPYLKRLRNVSEHFDDYSVDRGRDLEVKRSQLQKFAVYADEDGKPVWYWLGQEVRLVETQSAAVKLYRAFLATADGYNATAGY